MSEFTRIMWVSKEAEDVWTPKIEACKKAYEICLTKARAGDTLITIAPEKLHELTLTGKPFVIIDQEGTSKDSYHNAAIPFKAGQPFVFRVAMTNDSKAWALAWKDKNEDEIGRLLGYPKCCVEFFKCVWKQNQKRDTTLFMGISEDSIYCVENPIIPMTPANNILLRWLGIRLVPHLPCSFHCEETRKFGDAVLAEMYLTYPQEASDIECLLSMSLRYTSLHGAAEIQTPLFKIEASTDYLPAKHERMLDGWFYPVEGMRGNAYPNNQIHRRVHFETAKENGFNDLVAMNRLHHKLLRGILQPFNNVNKTILDLGCGNGILLYKLAARLGHCRIVGIDKDPEVVKAAARLFPEGTFVCGDIFDVYKNHTAYLATISVNRFKENLHENIENLKDYTKHLVVYNYDTPEGGITCYSKE